MTIKIVKLLSCCIAASLLLSSCGGGSSSDSNNIPDISATKLVCAYVLLNTPADLDRYMADLAKVNKVNFNRVIFSFIRPSLTNYKSGSLANTGIMGYFTDGDADGAAFNKLKAAVAASQAKGVQAFFSVGGWNYSCNTAIKSQNPCNAADSAASYDWFPDPTGSVSNDPAHDAKAAEKSYKNIMRLANDLNMNGLDLDYEEFWHADANAITWTPPADTNAAKAEIGIPTYPNIVKYAKKHSDPATGGIPPAGKSGLMPQTVAKLAGIIEILESNAANNFLFSAATPPVGARPITSFNSAGDQAATINTQGGLWWFGNLKGLWYNLADYNKALLDRFDSLGAMTYDLSERDAPYSGAATDLVSQVNAYMSDYTNWLKADKEKEAQFISSANSVALNQAKYNIKSKLQFGFEVNKPAYGNLQLTNDIVDKLTSTIPSKTAGVIIWALYSVQADGGTTTAYTLQKSCSAFLAADSRYDCKANFPQ